MDYKNTVFGEITAESIQDLKKIERLGKGILDLKIRKTEEVPLQIDTHDHHHHHWSSQRYYFKRIDLILIDTKSN